MSLMHSIYSLHLASIHLSRGVGSGSKHGMKTELDNSIEAQ